MRKITTMFALVLTFSFFCSFVSYAGTNGYSSQSVSGTLSEDSGIISYSLTKSTIENEYYNFGATSDYEDNSIHGGADSFYLTNTVTFEYSLDTSPIKDAQLMNFFIFYMTKKPNVHIDNVKSESGISDVYIKNINMYYVVNGKRYEIGENVTEYLYYDKLYSKANLIIEVDLLIFLSTADNYHDSILGMGSEYITFDVVCDAFSLRISKSSLLSEYGLFRTISNNLTTLASDLKIRFTQLMDSLTTWFDRQHDDMETANTKLQTLISSLQAFRILQHQDMLDLGEKLANEYDDTDADKTSTDFEDITSDLDDIQGGVVNDATDGLGEYTMNEDGAMKIDTNVATVAPLVSSMLQSIFETSPAIGIIMSVIFSMTLGCMLIGLFRYFKR